MLANPGKSLALVALSALLTACGTNGSSSSNNGSLGDVCASSVAYTDIEDYVEAIGPRSLSYVPGNLSGITYNYDRNTLFMIDNGSSTIWEATTSYQLIRTIFTNNFGDTEGITYLGNDEFAIVNEDSELLIGRIPPGTTNVNANDFQEIIFDTYSGNSGPEGVTFDVTTQRFYIVKEKSPRKVFTFIRPASNADMTITATEPFDAEGMEDSDISGVFFDPATGRLLVLSDEYYRVTDIALDGTVYGRLEFPNYEQYEGITLDCNRNLHVVAEPDLYHVYRPN